MRKLLLLIVLLLPTFSFAQQQFSTTVFDGEKFKTRYSLSTGDFSAVAQPDGTKLIILRPGITLPDNPPIFDAPDSPTVVARRVAAREMDDKVVLRAILLVILDQFNTLRALHGLPAITLPQARAAVQNKLDSGAAD